MTKQITCIIFTVLICTILSCEYEVINPIEVEFEGPISYTEQVEPIFQNKCVGCHSNTNPVLTTGNSYSNLIDGNYINTEDPSASEIYDKTNKGHPGGSNSLSVQELATLLQWIEEGATNDSSQ